jgi:hypothetical protein
MLAHQTALSTRPLTGKTVRNTRSARAASSACADGLRIRAWIYSASL